MLIKIFVKIKMEAEHDEGNLMLSDGADERGESEGDCLTD